MDIITPSHNSPYRVERGTIVLPWGGTQSMIDVWQSDIGWQGDGGNIFVTVPLSGTAGSGRTGCAGDRIFSGIRLLGKYMTGEKIGEADMVGTATLQIANGETWSGTCIINSIRAVSNDTSMFGNVAIVLSFTCKPTVS